MKTDQAPPPVEQVFQLVLGYMPAMALNIVSRLGVADQIAQEPKALSDLAKATGVNEDALYRLMRALSSVGVFHEAAGRRFGHTPGSELLRQDHPASIRPMTVWMSDPFHFRCYADLINSIQTGKPSAEKTLGQPVFEYFRDNADESEVFNAAMVSFTNFSIPAILEAYDFSGIQKLVDVGGGHGSVVGSILQKHPTLRGVLYDLDHVVAGAKGLLGSLGVADRCEVVEGNFFESVPAGGDAYIMKHIIHDWDDDKCRVILGHIRKVLPGNGKVLLLESIVPGLNEPSMSKWIDLEMMIFPGGRERTEEEFQKLFASAGFKLSRVTPTKSPLSVIEALPA